jgi:hypothetical protein
MQCSPNLTAGGPRCLSTDTCYGLLLLQVVNGWTLLDAVRSKCIQHCAQQLYSSWLLDAVGGFTCSIVHSNCSSWLQLTEGVRRHAWGLECSLWQLCAQRSAL